MRPTLFTFLVAVLLLFNGSISAASQPDSLEALVKTKTGTEKIDALFRLSVFYCNIQPRKGLEQARLALRMSEDLNYAKGKADSYASMGEIYINLADYNSALENHKKAYEIRKASGDKYGMSSSLNSLGEAMEHMGNYDQAMGYFFQAIKIEEDTQNIEELSASYSFVATLYYILKNYPKSLEFCDKALKVREKINDKLGLANSYELMGMVNYDLKKHEEALKYHKLALQVKISTGNKLGIAGSYQNLGLVYKAMGKYDLALSYFNKSWKIKEELDEKRGIAASITAIGETYEKQGKDELALEYILKALDIRKEIKDKRGTARSCLLAGNLYKKIGNYKNALEYLTLYNNYKDSLNNAKSLEKLTALSLQYKAETKDKEIALLQKDNIIQKTVRNSLVAGFAFVTIIAVLIFTAYRSKKKTSDLLEEKNKEISHHHRDLEKLNSELKISNATKDKFFSIIAHDLRSPFTGFLGLSEELALNSDNMNKEEVSEFGILINQSAKKIYGLLNNLLEWSLLQSGRMNPEICKVNIYTKTENISTLFSSSAKGKSISMINKVNSDAAVLADKKMVETVLRNLISNAIKFTGEGGLVTISSETKDDFIKVTVSDNGTGMDQEMIDKVFKTGFTLSTKGTGGETGSGLGLILCKELIEMNGGNISLSSAQGKGTSFSFTLPRYKDDSLTCLQNC